MSKEVKFIISGDGTRAKAAFKDVEGAAGGLRRGVGELNSTLSTFGAVLGGAGIVAAIQSATAAAVQMERATIGLSVTARYAGAGMTEASQAARELAKDGLMSVAEASQGLQNLLMRGFGLEEAIALMSRFKDSASFNRQASLEFGQAVVSATEGLKNENSILVDNAGVTKNVSVMWAEYARQLGVGEKSLTQAQKRQAEYNGILRETEGQVGNTALMSDTYQGAQARLNQEMFNAKVAFGQSLAPVLTDILRGMTPLIGLTSEFIGGLQMMSVEFVAFFDRFDALGSFDTVGFLFGGKSADEAAAEVKARLAAINQAVDEQKADIFKKASGGELPTIGRDTGARRSDIIAAPKSPVGGIVNAAKEATYDDPNGMVAEYEAQKAYLLESKADERAQNLAAQLEYDAIMREMELARYDESNTAFAASQRDKREQTALTADYQIQIAQDTASALMNISNALFVAGGKKSRAMFETNKIAGIANTTISTYTAAAGAMKDTPGPFPVRLAAAAAIVAAGLAQVASIQSTTFSGGGAAAGGYGGGTGTSPIVTQPTSSRAGEGAGTITVQIMGNVIGQDKWVEEELVPALRNLQGRNIVLAA